MKHLVTILIVLTYIFIFAVVEIIFETNFGLSREGNLIFGGCLLCGTTTIVCTCIILFKGRK